jgi:hypothetical protein
VSPIATYVPSTKTPVPLDADTLTRIRFIVVVVAGGGIVAAPRT